MAGGLAVGGAWARDAGDMTGPQRTTGIGITSSYSTAGFDQGARRWRLIKPRPSRMAIREVRHATCDQRPVLPSEQGLELRYTT